MRTGMRLMIDTALEAEVDETFRGAGVASVWASRRAVIATGYALAGSRRQKGAGFCRAAGDGPAGAVCRFWPPGASIRPLVARGRRSQRRALPNLPPAHARPRRVGAGHRQRRRQPTATRRRLIGTAQYQQATDAEFQGGPSSEDGLPIQAAGRRPLRPCRSWRALTHPKPSPPSSLSSATHASASLPPFGHCNRGFHRTWSHLLALQEPLPA